MYDVGQFKHKIKIKVRFSDLDAMRHVNNATYLTYLEEARIAYFKDVLNMQKNDLDFGAVVARIDISYLQPVTLGEEIEVLTRVSKLGNKSSDVEHIIIVNRNGEKLTAAEALTKLVSYDYEKLCSTVIPVKVKERIKEFEAIVH
jgi:acyl-CoA thioester hydrolase